MHEATTSEEKTKRTPTTQLPAPMLPSFEPATFDLDLSDSSASPSSSSLSSCFYLYATKVFTYSDFFCVALFMNSIIALCVLHPNEAWKIASCNVVDSKQKNKGRVLGSK